jgi:hypothetical protein
MDTKNYIPNATVYHILRTCIATVDETDLEMLTNLTFSAPMDAKICFLNPACLCTPLCMYVPVARQYAYTF